MQSSAPLYTNAQHVINLAALRVGSAIMHHRQYQALPMDVLYVGICRELQLVHTIIGYLIMSGIPHSVPPVIAKAGRWVRHTGALSDISDEEASEIPASKADMDELSWWLLTSPSKTTLESPLNVDSIPQKVIPVLDTSPALSATDTAALLGDLEMVRRHWKDAAELTRRFWQDHVDNTRNIEEDISILQSQMVPPKSP